MAEPPSIVRQGRGHVLPFVFTPIELADGLRGEVLTQCHAPALSRQSSRLLPSVEVWRTWLTQLVADYTALTGYSTLKYSRNGEVFRACLPMRQSEPLDVVCRFNRTGDQGISILGRPSRAARSLGRALRLLEVGIETAVPLAWIERKSHPRQSWLVTEYVADLVDLDQIVLSLLPQQDRRSSHKLKVGISEALVELVVRLEDAGLYHRDLKASNILFTHWDGRGGTARPMIVDLDGLHRLQWWNRRRQWQPLIRLAASLMDYSALTHTDFARFLHRYLRRVDTSSMEWKAHFRRLADRASEYAERSQLRKSHKLDGFTGA